MIKFVALVFLFLSPVAKASDEISYVNCGYMYEDGQWTYAFVSWMTRPFKLAAKETRVIEAASYYPSQDLNSPGVSRCSELVGTSTDKFILKTHHYRFQRFENFKPNSCVPVGEGVEFIEMTADLIAVGKPYFADLVYPWKPDMRTRTVFNVITAEQSNKLNEASEENRDAFFNTLCLAQKPY